MSNITFLGIVSVTSMKKLLLVIIPIVLAIVIFLGFTFFLPKNDGKGALQVTAVPESIVYLNGKQLGKTPLCACGPPSSLSTLSVGEYTIRVVSQDNTVLPYEEKIHISSGVMTVVDRSFGKGATSEGSILTLTSLKEKSAREVSIVSFPQGTEVSIDNNSVGQTPLSVAKITESDHEIKVKKSGYKEKIIRIRAVTGYKLEVLVTLGISDIISDGLPEQNAASPSAALSVTPTATSSAKVIILDTPTAYLNVRESGSLNAGTIDKVYPGEMYELVDEKESWFAIKLKTGQVGWISGQYAKKQ